MVVKKIVSRNPYTIQIMHTSNITGSSLGTMPPTELLADVPLANGQEQDNNSEGDVSDQSKSNNWCDALVLLTKTKTKNLQSWTCGLVKPSHHCQTN